MKKLLIIIAILTLSSATMAKESKSSESKISAVASDNPFVMNGFAIVDIQKILDEAAASKSAAKQVLELKQKYAKESQAKIEELKKSEAQIKSQQKALSQEAFALKVKDFQAKFNEGQKDAMKKKRIVENAYAKALELIRSAVVMVISEISAERKIDLVLAKGQILYARNGVDITDEVLERLDKKLSKVNITVQNKPQAKPAEKKK
jgi:Skp family chaperone for outer membrane proteins